MNETVSIITLCVNIMITVMLIVIIIKMKLSKPKEDRPSRKCYACGHPVVYADPSDGSYSCPKCGHKWGGKRR